MKDIGQPDSGPSAPPTTLPWAMTVTALIAWLFAVIVVYYVVHKPFDLPQVIAMAQVALDFALWAGLLAIAAGLGLRLLGPWPELRPAERVVFAAGLGLAVVGYGVMGLGLTGILTPWLLAVLAAAILVSIALRPQPVTIVWRQLRRQLPTPHTRFQRLLAAFALFSLALTFVWALAPPYAFDAAVYHLRQPQLYLTHHSLFVPVDSAYVGFPGLMQMLFTLTMALGGDSAPQLVHFTFLPLTILAAAALGRRLWDIELTWPVAAILTAVPTLLLLSAWPYVDAAVIFYTLLLFFALAIWLSDGYDRWLLMAAIICGIIIETKYTALWYPLACLPLVLLRVRSDGWRPTLRRLAWFGLIIALVAAPWYVRNWLLTGNPIYPYLWGGAGWDPIRAAWWDRSGTGLAAQPWRLVIAPWEMTVHGVEGKEGYSATLGPLLLALVPGLIALWPGLSSRARRPLAWMGLFGGVLYVVWLWGVARSLLLMQSRLLFPMLPLLALVAAFVLHRIKAMDRPVISVSWLIKTVVTLILVLNAFVLGTRFVSDRPLAPVLGVEPRADYVARHMGTAYTAAIQQINSLPPTSRTIFLWEPRTYHCQADCVPDSLYDNLVHFASRYSDARRVSDEMRARGITHLLLNHKIMTLAVAAGDDPITPKHLDVLADMQDRFLYPIYDDGVAYTLYQLQP